MSARGWSSSARRTSSRFRRTARIGRRRRFARYSAAHGFDPGKQTSAGMRIAMLFDDRDNPNDAIRGWYALATYRTQLRRLSRRRLVVAAITADVRTYRALTADKRHKLAFWGIGNFVTSGTAPYLVAAGKRRRRARAIDARLSGRTLSGRAADLRGSGVPRTADAQRIPRHDGLRQHYDDQQQGDGRTAVRFSGLRRRRGTARPRAQAFAIELVRGLRVRRDGSHGLYIGFRDAF